jgi:hypothetical protein
LETETSNHGALEGAFHEGHYGTNPNAGFRGGLVYHSVITRISWSWSAKQFLSAPSLVRMSDVEDGTSQTMLVGEKTLRPDYYQGSTYCWCDDYG